MSEKITRLTTWFGRRSGALRLQREYAPHRGTWLLLGGLIGLTLGVTSLMFNLCKGWNLVRGNPAWGLSRPTLVRYARAGRLALALLGLVISYVIEKQTARDQGKMCAGLMDPSGKGNTLRAAVASWLGKVSSAYAVMVWATYYLITLWADGFPTEEGVRLAAASSSVVKSLHPARMVRNNFPRFRPHPPRGDRGVHPSASLGGPASPVASRTARRYAAGTARARASRSSPNP
jgi:hypothetical protein